MYSDNENIHRYDDIINLPHHISKSHPQMPALDRAAQFSPFAALTGHGAAVQETARLTEKRIELSEDSIAILNNKIAQIKDKFASRPIVEFTYFVPDDNKDGGSYVKEAGYVKKIDEYRHTIILDNNAVIPIDDILDISSDDELFEG